MCVSHCIHTLIRWVGDETMNFSAVSSTTPLVTSSMRDGDFAGVSFLGKLYWRSMLIHCVRDGLCSQHSKMNPDHGKQCRASLRPSRRGSDGRWLMVSRLAPASIDPRLCASILSTVRFELWSIGCGRPIVLSPCHLNGIHIRPNALFRV